MSAEVVVANAGPLMAFSKLNILHQQAYHADLITADQLRFYFDQISERSDIWISSALCQRLLRELFPSES